MAQPLNIFRIVAAEFSNVDDETVNLWLGLTAPVRTKAQAGRLTIWTARERLLKSAAIRAAASPSALTARL